MMKLVLADEGVGLCGQACIAMSAGVSIKEVSSAVGHTNGLYVQEIISTLAEFGVRGWLGHGPDVPARAILVCDIRGGQKPLRHCVLLWDGEIYDPAIDCKKYGTVEVVAWIGVSAPMCPTAALSAK